MPLTLLGRLVAVKIIPRPSISKTIIIPDDAADDFAFGEVVLVGGGDPPPAADTYQKGVQRIPLEVRIGYQVFFSQRAKVRSLRFEGTDLVIINDDDILGFLTV